MATYAVNSNLTVSGSGSFTTGLTVSGVSVHTDGVLNTVEAHNVFIPFPGSGIDGTGDGSENVRFELEYSGVVNQATVKTETGTLDYSIQIADAVIEGIDNQAVTTTEATDTATSANIFSAGDEFNVAVSGALNAQEFRVTMKTTRT